MHPHACLIPIDSRKIRLPYSELSPPAKQPNRGTTLLAADLLLNELFQLVFEYLEHPFRRDNQILLNKSFRVSRLQYPFLIIDNYEEIGLRHFLYITLESVSIFRIPVSMFSTSNIQFGHR